MSIPYTDVEINYTEYNQELGINNMADKLLANDQHIYGSISTALSGDLKELRIANKLETKALATTTKAVAPNSVMTVSATDTDITNAVENRFMTADKYATFVERAQPITLWADLCFGAGFISSTFPSDSTILAAAENYLNNFSPRNGTLLYVRYIYTRHWRTKHKRSIFGGHYHRNHYLDYQFQDTYKRISGVWVLIRRRQSNRI